MAELSPFRKAWVALAAEDQDGRWERRLDPNLPLYATRSNPDGVGGLEFRGSEPLEFEPSELRSSEQFEFGVSPTAPGTLVLEARSGEAVEIFVRIADDLVALATTKADPPSAVRAMVRRFNTWQRFLKETPGGLLSERRRLGLVGELATMRDLFIPAVGPLSSVEAWTGPARAPQDFQLSHIAVEVKTIVHSEPQTLRIDGERQLDDFGLDVLAIAHHRVFVHKGSGQTLPELVAEVRAALASSATALEIFDEKLIGFGYVEDDRTLVAYRAQGYSLKHTSYYRVRGSAFPRLTEIDLRPGMGQVEYSVAAAVCEPFAVDEPQLAAWLVAPEPAVDPASTLESREVEYKRTIWAPTQPLRPGETQSSVTKELQNSVIKTVVAFMNTDGGELVIGVRDSDRAVTGIGADLEFRKWAVDDVDGYELALMRLLSERIDQLAHRQIRLSFQPDGDQIACHVAVGPSPNPRFGRPFPKEKQQPRPVFWVRSGNATVELEGAAMLDYIAAQW